ncbi:MAG TPA: hypothetical protein PKD67_00840 [Ignavibacteriaceae bacterium]|jgi:hypothetical protein|nr:hypothetical protein [Ignavibacteriaceae bacterium]
MGKSNLFFTYLSNLIPQKENPVKDANKKEDLIFQSNENPNTDNEWLQEYELIYRSYATERY